MGHSSIELHYKFERVMKREGYSLFEIADMYPFEKDVHAALINMERQKEQQENG